MIIDDALFQPKCLPKSYNFPENLDFFGESACCFAFYIGCLIINDVNFERSKDNFSPSVFRSDLFLEKFCIFEKKSRFRPKTKKKTESIKIKIKIEISRPTSFRSLTKISEDFFSLIFFSRQWRWRGLAKSFVA